ncbi:uncharacterized protein LOC115630507 [Scaptodrosophila lebanonensis]|uniref:Uncharacterized protein LOC115630507 n=1 Tax=Drosophila lebanonensis TaxID=7225 RepID=A0A6J2U4V6_DROLE|nr:uncharacterized protein LOC115630507 [Scaptodrosophila lebanonensis]
MQVFRSLARFIKAVRVVQPSLLRTVTEAQIAMKRSYAKSYLNPKFQMEEQEELEAEEENCVDPLYPILQNRKSNLFFMPNEVGPAYRNQTTTTLPFRLIDRYSSHIEYDHVDISSAKSLGCPLLLLGYMRRMFVHPFLEFTNPDDFSVINLHFDSDVDSAIKAFVLIARQYSVDILNKGFWADFVNPFTGRAYFKSAPGRRKLVKEARFLSNLAFETNNGCVFINEPKQSTFTGAIFTDIPYFLIEPYNWNI